MRCACGRRHHNRISRSEIACARRPALPTSIGFDNSKRPLPEALLGRALTRATCWSSCARCSERSQRTTIFDFCQFLDEIVDDIITEYAAARRLFPARELLATPIISIAGADQRRGHSARTVSGLSVGNIRQFRHLADAQQRQSVMAKNAARATVRSPSRTTTSPASDQRARPAIRIRSWLITAPDCGAIISGCAPPQASDPRCDSQSSRAVFAKLHDLIGDGPRHVHRMRSHPIVFRCR